MYFNGEKLFSFTFCISRKKSFKKFCVKVSLQDKLIKKGNIINERKEKKKEIP